MARVVVGARRRRNIFGTVVMLRGSFRLLVMVLVVLVEHGSYFILLEVSEKELLIDVETEGEFMARIGFVVVVVHYYDGWAMIGVGSGRSVRDRVMVDHECFVFFASLGQSRTGCDRGSRTGFGSAL